MNALSDSGIFFQTISAVQHEVSPSLGAANIQLIAEQDCDPASNLLVMPVGTKLERQAKN